MAEPVQRRQNPLSTLSCSSELAPLSRPLRRCAPPSEPGAPCYKYCTQLDFKSLEAGDMQQHKNSFGPYNFASLFTTYFLEVRSSSPMGGDRGIDLTGVEQIELGE